MSLAQHELLGLRAQVVASGDPGLLGRQGLVVDETRGTLTLDISGRDVVVPKVGQEFQFTLPDGSQQRLRGQELAHRPEDRTKKARPRAQGS